MMIMSDAMLLCQNFPGHPDWSTGTRSNPAASSKLCWGAQIEMHSKEPRDESVRVFRCMCRAPMPCFTHNPSHLYYPLLVTRCCEQNSRTCGLRFHPCLYAAPCRTIGTFEIPFLSRLQSWNLLRNYVRWTEFAYANAKGYSGDCVCESGFEHESALVCYTYFRCSMAVCGS